MASYPGWVSPQLTPSTAASPPLVSPSSQPSWSANKPGFAALVAFSSSTLASKPYSANPPNEQQTPLEPIPFSVPTLPRSCSPSPTLPPSSPSPPSLLASALALQATASSLPSWSSLASSSAPRSGGSS